MIGNRYIIYFDLLVSKNIFDKTYFIALNMKIDYFGFIENIK